MYNDDKFDKDPRLKKVANGELGGPLLSIPESPSKGQWEEETAKEWVGLADIKFPLGDSPPPLFQASAE